MNQNDQHFAVQKIRTQYIQKESTDLDALRALDAKVRRPANLLAYALGSVAALIMGAGMSLVMTDIGSTLHVANPLVSGIIIGVCGMAMAIVNYPIYRSILGARKAKYSEQILALSEKMMNQ